MKKLLVSALLLTVLAALGTGCRNTSRLISTGLRVEVVSLDRAADGSVSAAWRVANPNVVAYLISETSHKIYLDGILVGTIHDTEPLGVPASANADRTTPLKGGAAAGARALTEAIARGSAGYRVDSQITIRVYDEMLEKAVLTNSGTVAVTTK